MLADIFFAQASSQEATGTPSTTKGPRLLAPGMFRCFLVFMGYLSGAVAVAKLAVRSTPMGAFGLWALAEASGLPFPPILPCQHVGTPQLYGQAKKPSFGEALLARRRLAMVRGDALKPIPSRSAKSEAVEGALGANQLDLTGVATLAGLPDMGAT